MKKFTVCLVVGIFTIMMGSVSAYQDTRTSAEYTHGGGVGSYCSMTTTVEVNAGRDTQLYNVNYNKSSSLGYSFRVQGTPNRYHYSSYDNYVSNNSLLWMNGATTWDFQLTTTHPF